MFIQLQLVIELFVYKCYTWPIAVTEYLLTSWTDGRFLLKCLRLVVA